MASSPISTGSPASSTSSTPALIRGRPSVRALLAELSDSDNDSESTTRSLDKQPISKQFGREIIENESSEDDLPIGGGRLASRLAGNDAPKSTNTNVQERSMHSKSLGDIQQKESATTARGRSEEDEIVPQPKKRFLLKRKRTLEIEEEEHLPPQSPSPSHRNVSSQKSPTPSRSANSDPGSPSPNILPLGDEPAAPTGKSRFKELVQKAREQREAREEAEKAKKSARAAQETSSSPQKRRSRGSSPADDSEEESDQSDRDAAKKLTKAARPTRKAGKKALEEMNRETQRMTRNMQLAHQARTKKKFTKESFFASFKGSLPIVAEDTVLQQGAQSMRISPSSSDAENARIHDTPPTSPLRSPALNKTAKLSAVDDVAMTSGGIQESLEDMDSFEDIFASRRTENENSKIVLEKGVLKKVKQAKSSTAASVYAVRDVTSHNDPGSDSEIEVIFDTGHRRKYAAFENLPKKKAKEMPSHLALRSLAHVRQTKDKKSLMSGAEVGPSLLKAARRQALEERQEKIEKLKAAGVIIQTAEEKEKDEEILENLVERAREEDEEIRKREKELSKKEGTYVKDALDDDDSDDEDEDFQDEDPEEDANSDSGEEDVADDEDGVGEAGLVDDAAEESAEESAPEDEFMHDLDTEEPLNASTPIPSRTSRNTRVILDDEEDENAAQAIAQTPVLPPSRKTPQSILRSNRKVIPGLQHSDDLPIGLTQAFAATMAESQTQNDEPTQEQDSMDILRDLPSPHFNMAPRLGRIESMDMISESVQGTQTQPLGLDFGLSQSQRVPESPVKTRQVAASQAPFELTQDAGYSFSPFSGNRFSETPKRQPQSTEETIILPVDENSPIVSRKGRLQRGRQTSPDAEDEVDTTEPKSAFQVMSKATKRKEIADFNKQQSEARRAVDEAAEESDDEYAGLGGASDDDDNDEENEEDRQMIDEDTEIGKGDAAKLAKLYADRERQADEAAVNKMMKDITTGALRRKRAVGDDLDLSDEEDAATRRRESKRREFAKMRRELLKDEAVGKIADDKKKQAFLKSIEDHEDEEDNEDFDQPETQPELESQEQSQQVQESTSGNVQSSRPLQQVKDSQLNQRRSNIRRAEVAASKRPGTLAEIRESVSFLIEEPDSQAGILDLGLSDSEDEPEAYVNLDRHLQQAEADEDAMNDGNDDLGDFVVDEEDISNEESDSTFKKPELPHATRDRAPFSDRRTNSMNVIDRLSLLRQASSSSAGGSNASSKMAFFSSKAGSGTFSNVPNLLRRATTNSGLGSMSGRENVSATGVVTSKTERGSAAQEKDFVRKGTSTSRNAVNYQGRQNLKEEKMSARAGIAKKKQQKKKSGGGFLGNLFNRSDSWN